MISFVCQYIFKILLGDIEVYRHLWHTCLFTTSIDNCPSARYMYIMLYAPCDY